MSGCHAGWGTSPRHGSRWGAAGDDRWDDRWGRSWGGSWGDDRGDRSAGPAEPRPGAAADDRVRVGDAERDAAVAALGEHYALGRLTSAEHDERTRVALEARTAADLAVLLVDLPHTSAASPGDGPQAGWSGARSGPLSDGRRRRQSRRGPGVPGVPWLPVVVLVVVGLVVLSALTHAPWILIGVALWFLLRGPRHRWAHTGHGGHGGQDRRGFRPAEAGAPSRG